MKKLRKLLVIASILLGVFVLNDGTAFAKDFYVHNEGREFNKSWSNEIVGPDNSRFIYGYNTFAINEDFMKCNRKTCVGYIVNGNGRHEGKSNFTTVWSRVDVTHKAPLVLYGITY